MTLCYVVCESNMILCDDKMNMICGIDLGFVDKMNMICGIDVCFMDKIIMICGIDLCCVDTVSVILCRKSVLYELISHDAVAWMSFSDFTLNLILVF